MGVFRRYQWRYEGWEFEYRITWPDSWRRHVESLTHSITDPQDYEYYVDNDPYLNNVCEFFDDLLNLGVREGAVRRRGEALVYLLRFVQHLRYLRDIGEYPKYPMETLIDRGGDCEDSAMLMAVAASYVGYRCVLIVFDCHVDLGIRPESSGEFHGSYWTHEGSAFYYASCNGRNRDIGDYSGTWGRRAHVYPIAESTPFSARWAFVP